jgi:hypothetical protein
VGDRWDALRQGLAELVRNTQKHFEERRQWFGLIFLAPCERWFVKAYIELIGTLRSLELEELYTQFRKSSEATRDYVDDQVLDQVGDILIAMVARGLFEQAFPLVSDGKQ